MSERGSLFFLSDVELAAFLWRHICPQYEKRTLTLIKHDELISRMEKASDQSSSWRLRESQLHSLFSQLFSTNPELRCALSTQLSHLRIVVQGEQEAGWLVELLDLTIEREVRPSSLEKLTREQTVVLDILVSLISATVDQSDPFAATRLLSFVCPEVLPVLRKRTAETSLNLVQSLLSFSMTARIHDAGEDDAILSKHLDILKSFDHTIDEMHERMHEYPDCNRSISSMLTSASNFLLKTPAFTNDVANLKKAQTLVQQQLKQLIGNEKTITANIPSGHTDAPEFLTRCDRVCRSLLDRFTGLEVSGEAASDINMTPAFKTPQVPKAETPKNEQKDDVCVTPKVEEVKQANETQWLISSLTPTPRGTRNVEMSIYEELLDEEKENIPPGKKMVDENDGEVEPEIKQQKKNVLQECTPVRWKSGGLRVRGNGEERKALGEKTIDNNYNKRRSKGADGEAKKAKNAPPSQTSITAFFIRK